MKLDIHTKQREYSIYIGRGMLGSAASLIGTDRRSFIITDSGVPDKWVRILSEQFEGSELLTFPKGESNKNINTYGDILSWLSDRRAGRKDRIIAIGGGVCGDMAGFAAATYMRGIEYINIPTTSLSQIDSGIGGKTAIDHNGVKNLVGAFRQPSMVIIDPGTLDTLSKRELNNGFAEAVKAGLIGDAGLFEIFEHDNYMDCIDEIIERSLMVKKRIVEEDENEASLRKVLNFGHTLGHAYESYFGGKYLHGECVAMGMMKMTEGEGLKERLAKVLERLELPREPEDADAEAILQLVMSDKKAGNGTVDIVRVREIGKAVIESADMETVRRLII